MSVPRYRPPRTRNQTPILEVSIPHNEIVPGSCIFIIHTPPDRPPVEIPILIPRLPRLGLADFQAGNTLRIPHVSPQGPLEIFLTILHDDEDNDLGPDPRSHSLAAVNRGAHLPPTQPAPQNTLPGSFLHTINNLNPSYNRIHYPANSTTYAELLSQALHDPSIETLISNAFNDSFLAGPGPRRHPPRPSAPLRLSSQTPTNTPPRQPTRQPIAGKCPICQEDLTDGDGDGDGREVVWCEGGCGQNVHRECLVPWIGTTWLGWGEPNCPACRARWSR